MESAANLQVSDAVMAGSRRGTEGNRAEVIRRRHLARMIPLPAICAGCGEPVELRFEPTRWCDPGTFMQHACRVRRAS